jgi:diguanylate cyclase (GGDEF)-like protein
LVVLALVLVLLQAAQLVLAVYGEWPASPSVVAGLALAGLLVLSGLGYVLWRRWTGLEAERQQALADYACLREAIDEMPAAIELYDAEDRLVICNQRMEQLYPDSARTRGVGQRYEELLRRAQRQGMLIDAPAGHEEEWIALRLAGRGRGQAPQLRRLPGGGWAHLYEARTTSGCIVAVRVDVTESVHQREVLSTARAEAQAAHVRLREAIDAMPAGVAIYDEDDRLVMYNREVTDMAPYSGGGELIGQTYETLVRRSLARGEIEEALGREDEWLRQRLAARGLLKVPVLRRASDGRWMHFHETRAPSGAMIMVRLDVTDLVEKSLELERANELLSRLSTTDSLTGLANRRLFDQSLQAEWLRSARSQQPISLLMIDVDYFKRYNDHYGHLTGDACLRQIAGILFDCAQRSGEVVARYGGEEFAMLLPGADVEAARVMAQRCMDELGRAAIPHANSPVAPWLTISIGVATAIADQNLLPESLVECADAALYRTKGSGRARFEVVSA